MTNKSDLVKEEFTQNYLQYRWLDDTRTRFTDRFFILTAAVFLVKFQFDDYLTKNWVWLLVIYIFYAIISISFARTINLFRRQQRGHNNYISYTRSILLDKILNSPSPEFSGGNPELAKEYKDYLDGRKVHLTVWIEMAITLIASSSPLLLLDVLRVINVDLKCLILCFIVLISLTVVLLYRLIPPWKCYNFKDQILWNFD